MGNHLVLVILSWVIGLANDFSALLVGPMLGLLLRHRAIAARRVQGAGWFILFSGQLTFLIFGFKSGLPGFLYAQPWMIPIAAANFVAWLRIGHADHGPSRWRPVISRLRTATVKL